MNPSPSNKISIQLLEKNRADEAVAQDLYQVAQAGFQGESPWSIDHLLNTITAKNALIFLARYEGENAGFIAATQTPFEIDIFFVVVAAVYKKKKVGTQLFEHLLEYARTKNIEAITLETRISNLPALALYEKVGFQRVGTRKAYYSQPIEDAVVMKHELGKEK